MVVTTVERRKQLLPAAVAAVAAPLGALAVVSPQWSIAALAGLAFVAAAVASVAAGLALFTTLTFFALIPGFGTSFVSLVKIAGAVLLVALGRKVARPSLVREHPLVAGLAVVLAAWAAASALWAPDVGGVRRDAVTLALSILLLFVVYGAIRKPKHARWLVHAYVIGCVCSAVVGVATGAPAGEDTSRLSGGVGDPNELALVLLPGLALAFFALPGARSALERWLLAAACGVMTIALFETGSRGGLIALGVSFAVALVYGGARRPHVLCALLALAAVGAGYFAVAAPPEVRARVGHLAGGGGNGRTDLWSIARQVAADHPVHGIGIGNFEVVEPAYAARTTNVSAVDVVVDEPHVVHNTYLELLAELGIVGLSIFVALVVTILRLARSAVRAAVRAGEADLELLTRGLVVGLGGVLTASIFLSAEYEKQLWLLLGLAAALARLTRTTDLRFDDR